MPATAEMESLVPVLRYRDVELAARWLCAAFGFELKTLVRTDSNVDAENLESATPQASAIYAEVVHGRGTIMLVPVGQSDLDAHMRQPDELGGIETQTCYVTVADPSTHMKRAVLGGAEIVLPLSGGAGDQHGYSCRDVEGHLWNFGTYAPVSVWNNDVTTSPSVISSQKTVQKTGGRWAAPMLTLSLMGLAAGVWFIPGNPLSSTAKSLLSKTVGTPQSGTALRLDAPDLAQVDVPSETRRSQDTILKLRQEVAEARAAVKAAQDAANAATKDLAAEYARRTEATQGTETATTRVSKLDAELAASKNALANLENELLKERSARGQSVQAADAARTALEQEVKRREQLEQLVGELDRKADDRLQPSKLDRSQEPASLGLGTPGKSGLTGNSESENLAPSVTGSIGLQNQNVQQSTEKNNSEARQVPRVRDTSSAREKSAVKRPRPAAQSATASKGTSSKSKEEKPWPYSAW